MLINSLIPVRVTKCIPASFKLDDFLRSLGKSEPHIKRSVAIRTQLIVADGIYFEVVGVDMRKPDCIPSFVVDYGSSRRAFVHGDLIYHTEHFAIVDITAGKKHMRHILSRYKHNGDYNHYFIICSRPIEIPGLRQAVYDFLANG